MKKPEIAVKRIYDSPADSDGARVLVDRIWPRGIAKANARLDYWAKDLAPSTELRKWFAHDPAKWEKFRKDYTSELDAGPQTAKELEEIIKLGHSGKITLLYAAHDTAHNNAVVLQAYIGQKFC